MLFALEETTLWTHEDALFRLRESIPSHWVLQTSYMDQWHRASILDVDGNVQWVGEHSDPKLLYLDALGWLSTRERKVQHPAWKPREQEVPLYRETPLVVSSDPDPEDLDPVAVASVYNHRNS